MSSSLKADEMDKFSAMAERWWDQNGPMRPLHRMNPARLMVIRDILCARFKRDPATPYAFEGLSLLDIGCGAGLLSEPLARLGARVTGIDPTPGIIEAARAHAALGGLTIDYRSSTAEALVEAGETFDAVLAMEVIEHVADQATFIKTCARLVKPGGVLIVSTLNRTLRSFGLAIVGAEYILRWLPRGTHDWEMFVTPDELQDMLEEANCEVLEVKGLVFNPLTKGWHASRDTGVNYLIAALHR